MVLRGDLVVEGGIWRRGGEEGRGKPGGRTKGGGKGDSTLTPVNARVVAGKPRETQHQLEVSKGGKLKGKVF